MQRCMQICSLFAMIGNREVNDQKKPSDNICEYKLLAAESNCYRFSMNFPGNNNLQRLVSRALCCCCSVQLLCSK